MHISFDISGCLYAELDIRIPTCSKELKIVAGVALTIADTLGRSAEVADVVLGHFTFKLDAVAVAVLPCGAELTLDHEAVLHLVATGAVDELVVILNVLIDFFGLRVVSCFSPAAGKTHHFIKAFR